mgnify:CR=1 FL=1
MEKNIINTGANRGIGKATVEKFASKQCNIWACARKKDENFENYLEELSYKNNIWIKPIYFELSDPESIELGIKQIIDDKCNIDVLVNNAGINIYNIFQMTRIEDAKKVFQIDYFAPFQIMQIVLKRMTKQKSGAIINISSVAALDTHAGDSVYGSAKSALITLSRAVATEVGRYGIKVNVVAPGPVETEMIRKNMDKVGSTIFSNSIMERLAKPEEIADVIYYLSSEEAAFINGQVIKVDGGKK